jgi:DNA-binding NarL/FixJ family response regulator
MKRPITIVVADDHPLYRAGVVASLRENELFEVCGECASAAEAEALAREMRPDVALIDISMPGGGLNAARAISDLGGPTRIVMLTVSERDDDIMRALEAGACGYVLKGVGGDELADIVENVASGGSYVTPSLAAHLLVTMRQAKSQGGSGLSSLTAREEQILRLVADGMSNKEVGLKLDLQEKTVKHYMTSILQKLAVRNRVEAAVLAREYWDRRQA